MNTLHDTTTLNSLKTLREIIIATMERLVERYQANPGYGWIDMKFDARTGEDTSIDPGIRDRNHVYSWIQGRGLEALTTHMEWFQRFPGMKMVDTSVLLDLGRTIATRLQQLRPALGGHYPFLMDSNGKGLSRQDSCYTMSDLFCARGLYAFHASHGTKCELDEARMFLQQVVEAILYNNFVNDQVSFDPSQYREGAVARTSYAGYMLALGAVTLLMRKEQDPQAVQQGKSLITYVIDHHINQKDRWRSIKDHTIVEWLDRKGKPYRDNGVIVLDPGHALEFIGLAAQMIHTWQEHFTLDSEDEAWIAGTLAQLYPALKTNLAHGYHSPGGILKSVDAETGNPMHDSMPWWALPETLRALVLVGKLSNSQEAQEWTHEWFQRGLQDFTRNYYKISKSGVAVQTINTSGLPVAVIPATPDLDPGYHTGLSLIDCHTILAACAPLHLGKAELDITPKVGKRLSGHVARTKPSDRILDPLKVRICLLESPYNMLVVISADVLEFSAEWAKGVQDELSTLLGLQRSGIFLTATHTHTAPPMIDLGTLPADSEYMQQVRKAIVAGCIKAHEHTIPIRLYAGSSSVDIGINRRVYSQERKRYEMKPNPLGSRDDGLGILVCKDLSDQVQAIWFNAAVHPTTLGVGISAISADYPGRVGTYLRSRLGDQVLVLPLTGACGDVRPAVLCTDSNSFREGTEADIDLLGNRVAERILETLPSCREVGKDSKKGFLINHALRAIEFPLRNLPTREQLEDLLENLEEALSKASLEAEKLDDFTRAHDNPTWALHAQKVWAERLLEQQWPLAPYAQGDLLVASLGDRVLLYALPGELFSSVGLKIKGIVGNMLSLLAGYTGGSLGYFPSHEAALQGGYETEEAFKYYGVPGPFGVDTEDVILETAKVLVKEVIQPNDSPEANE